MNEIKFDVLIQASIERTKLILFRPFHFRRWMSFLLIAFLAGTLTSGGGRGDFAPNADQPLSSENAKSNQSESATGDPASTSDIITDTETLTHNQALLSNTGIPQAPGSATGNSFPVFLIVIVAFFALALIILFTWLSSRFRFIWIHAIARNQTALKAPFKQFALEANSLFVVTLILALFSLVLLSIPVIGVIISFGGVQNFIEQAGQLPISFWLGAYWSPVLILVVVATWLLILYVWIEDFVVPVMMTDHVRFLPAWQTVLHLYQAHRRFFWFYLLIKAGLNILTGILMGILAFVLMLAALVAGFVVFGIPYFLFVSMLKFNLLFLICLVIFGVPYLALFLICVLSINLPFAMFYRCFSLYFMSTLDSKFRMMDDIPDYFN